MMYIHKNMTIQLRGGKKERLFILIFFILKSKFTNQTGLDEIQMFCDSLDCPNYTYSDVLKLHAYYISKKEIKLRSIRSKEFQDSNSDDIQCDSKDDSEKSSFSSYDFGVGDSESNSDIGQKETTNQKTKRNQKNWSEQEIKCLINGVHKFGNQWQKILKGNIDIFVNKTADNLRNKANQLKKNPDYSYLFDS